MRSSSESRFGKDRLWRLTVALVWEVPGSPISSRSGISKFVIELDGTEAETLGAVLARCTRVLKEATGVEIVYVHICGDGVPHLHLHLAPHRPGDALNDQMIRGDITEETLPSGMTRIVSRQFPPLPVEVARGGGADSAGHG